MKQQTFTKSNSGYRLLKVHKLITCINKYKLLEMPQTNPKQLIQMTIGDIFVAESRAYIGDVGLSLYLSSLLPSSAPQSTD